MTLGFHREIRVAGERPEKRAAFGYVVVGVGAAAAVALRSTCRSKRAR